MSTPSLLERHPLQRLNAPSRSSSAIVHIIGLYSFWRSFVFLHKFPNEVSQGYGWHFQFLTIIGLGISALTFVFGLLADLSLSPRIFFIKNACAVVSAPLEVLISLLYWGLIAIDRSLVVPPGMELPLLADCGFHLFPALLLLVDLLALSPPWTFSVIPALAVPASLAVGYFFFLEECYKHNGFYPYPLMNGMELQSRILLFAASALTMTGSTLALKWVYGVMNGNLERGAVPGDVKVKQK